VTVSEAVTVPVSVSGTDGADGADGADREAVELAGDLRMPAPHDGSPADVVLFAHGSGSSRFSPRNRAVAQALDQYGLGTLLIDLLTEGEERVDAQSGHLRFDIGLLGERVVTAVDWLAAHPATRGAGIHLFGASTGAAAALVGAAERPERVVSVVSRGGRPDLAGGALERVRAPVLLLVGGRDPQVIDLNREAAGRLPGEKQVRIVPGATHLFEEPGALEEVADASREWFVQTGSR
jgi:putative phosphoribosyl transferase